jgi:hypothetical protein
MSDNAGSKAILINHLFCPEISAPYLAMIGPVFLGNLKDTFSQTVDWKTSHRWRK